MPAHGVTSRLLLCGPLLAAAVACGSSDYTYVKNADAGLYLKVPRAWDPVDAEQLHAVVSGDPSTELGKLARAHSWHAGFDAAVQPSAVNVLTPSPKDPVVWVFVRDVGPAVREQLSLNAMRDWTMKVNEAAQLTATAGVQATGFEIVSDTALNPRKGLYGLHTVFNHRLGDMSYTIDQTVLTNDRQSKVYYLVVKCSTQCYNDRRDEISTVVNSFTVRG